MNRRSFFSSLIGAFAGTSLARLFRKPKTDLSDWTVKIVTGPSYDIPRKIDVWLQNPDRWDDPGVQVFAELPEPITSIHVIDDHLFAFTDTGIYYIDKDGAYEKLDDPILTIDDFSDRYLTPLEPV